MSLELPGPCLLAASDVRGANSCIADPPIIISTAGLRLLHWLVSVIRFGDTVLYFPQESKAHRTPSPEPFLRPPGGPFLPSRLSHPFLFLPHRCLSGIPVPPLRLVHFLRWASAQPLVMGKHMSAGDVALVQKKAFGSIAPALLHPIR